MALTSSLTNYALKAVANTFTALQTFTNGINVTGNSSFGDVNGNFLQQTASFTVSATATVGISSNPIIIPVQTAMLVIIELQAATSAQGYIQLTPPDAKYIGQRFILINRTAYNLAPMVGASNYIMGNGTNWSLNVAGSTAVTTKRTGELIFIGNWYQSAPSFVLSGN